MATRLFINREDYCNRKITRKKFSTCDTSCPICVWLRRCNLSGQAAALIQSDQSDEKVSYISHYSITSKCLKACKLFLYIFSKCSAISVICQSGDNFWFMPNHQNENSRNTHATYHSLLAQAAQRGILPNILMVHSTNHSEYLQRRKAVQDDEDKLSRLVRQHRPQSRRCSRCTCSLLNTTVGDVSCRCSNQGGAITKVFVDSTPISMPPHGRQSSHHMLQLLLCQTYIALMFAALPPSMALSSSKRLGRPLTRLVQRQPAARCRCCGGDITLSWRGPPRRLLWHDLLRHGDTHGGRRPQWR